VLKLLVRKVFAPSALEPVLFGAGVKLRSVSALGSIRFAGIMLFGNGSRFVGSMMIVSGSKEEKSPFRKAVGGIDSNCPGVSLAGTGGVAQATPSATSLTFGTQGLNDTSAAKKVTLTNKNSTAITLFCNTITGTNASAFAISATTCSSRC
jgi:hypothetical protein